VFRSGDKHNPQFRGVTTYYEIAPDQRIVSSEIIARDGKKLLISLSTIAMEPEASGTKITVTTQLTSLIVRAQKNIFQGFVGKRNPYASSGQVRKGGRRKS
jgi:uncharacterized protein YndB with AHSA1/START domain